jgi:hypothetical protein
MLSGYLPAENRQVNQSVSLSCQPYFCCRLIVFALQKYSENIDFFNLFERLFISHKIYIHNIHCQGLSHSIPTNITLVKYSGDDVAREEQYIKTEQEETKKKQQENKKTTTAF